VYLCPKRGQTSSLVDVLEPVECAPFLKWAGGKQWFAPLVPEITPDDWTGTYHEPFLGGGSVFFALNPHHAILGDANSDLINTYRVVRSKPDSLIASLKRMRNDASTFTAIRGSCPRSPVERAARFIYLNKTAWNGLYRVNQQGQFNVPFGRYQRPTICNSHRLRRASAQLKSATLHHADFASTLCHVGKGDLVFIDPPYITGHTNNGFLKYNAHLFSLADQQRLAGMAVQLRRYGAHVIITHAPFQPVLELYRGFHYYLMSRNSLIASDRTSRHRVSEAVLTSFPLLDIDTEII